MKKFIWGLVILMTVPVFGQSSLSTQSNDALRASVTAATKQMHYAWHTFDMAGLRLEEAKFKARNQQERDAVEVKRAALRADYKKKSAPLLTHGNALRTEMMRRMNRVAARESNPIKDEYSLRGPAIDHLNALARQLPKDGK